MPQEKTALVIPSGVQLQQTDKGISLIHNGDIILHSNLGEPFNCIRSLDGDIILHYEAAVEELDAPKGKIITHSSLRANRVSAEEIRIKGDIRVDNISTTKGALQVKGALQSSEITVNGNCNIFGAARFDSISVRGNLTILGDVQCESIDNSGNLHFGGFTVAKTIRSEGKKLQAQKPMSAKKIMALNSTVTLQRDADIELIRVAHLILQGNSNEIKAIQTFGSLHISEGEILSDVVLTNELNISQNTKGKIMVVEAKNEQGPHSVKGCLQLSDLDKLIPNPSEFLAQYGLELQDTPPLPPPNIDSDEIPEKIKMAQSETIFKNAPDNPAAPKNEFESQNYEAKALQPEEEAEVEAKAEAEAEAEAETQSVNTIEIQAKESSKEPSKAKGPAPIKPVPTNSNLDIDEPVPIEKEVHPQEEGIVNQGDWEFSEEKDQDLVNTDVKREDKTDDVVEILLKNEPIKDDVFIDAISEEDVIQAVNEDIQAEDEVEAQIVPAEETIADAQSQNQAQPVRAEETGAEMNEHSPHSELVQSFFDDDPIGEDEFPSGLGAEMSLSEIMEENIDEDIPVSDDFDPDEMDAFDNIEYSDEQPNEPDPFIENLLYQLEIIENHYTENAPEAVELLRASLEEGDIQKLQSDINQIWSRLLKHHQRSNTRIPPQVTYSFNTIHQQIEQNG